MKAEKQETNKLWAKLGSKSKNSDQFPDYDLFSQTCIVGRDEKTCDVWIQSQLVSANHAKIIFTDKKKAVLQDTSTNGTFINGVKAARFFETEIKQGDTLTFARNQLKPEDDIEYVFHFVDQPQKQDADIGKAPNDNQLDDDYQCTLCQEVIYQCVTLNPCKHNFCGACMTEWLKNKAFDCPNCKRTAVSLEKNPLANDIIKRFLEKNPEFQRDRQEYDRLNHSNFLTSDSLNLVKLGATQNHGRKSRQQQQPDSYLSFDSNDIPSEDQSEKREDPSPQQKGPKGSPARPEKIDIEPPPNRLVLAKPNVEPPQKGAKSGVDLCFGCKTGLDDEIDPDLECLICQKRYCSRGAVGSQQNECRQARKPRTKLVLMGLGEHEVPETITEDVCRDNKFEWDALIKYNRSHGATTQTIWEQAQNMFQHGAFTLKLTKEFHSNSRLNKELKLDMKSPVCGSCFDSLVWFQIVFNYRQGIRQDMPESIRNRGYCYFGMNCRTMAHNDDHAKKLDHFKEQTKF